MPGANYMGGKRNAAKARSKDTTGRAQKGFFGRQRLEMLSKGLSCKSSTPLFPNHSLGASITDIALAHAKHSQRENVHGHEPAHLTPYSFIPSPIRISPCTPRSRSRKTKSNGSARDRGSSESGRSNKSSVLEALDTSEPISLRAALDQVLAFPDLAGLSRRQRRPEEPHELITRRKRCMPDDCSPKARKRQKTATPEHLLHQNTTSSDFGEEDVIIQGDIDLLSSMHGDVRTPEFSHSHEENRVTRFGDEEQEFEEFDSMEIYVSSGPADDEADYRSFETGLEAYRDQTLHYKHVAASRSSSPSLGFWDSEDHEERISNIKLNSLDLTKSPSIDVPALQPPFSIDHRRPMDHAKQSMKPAGVSTSPSNFPDNLYDHEDPWRSIGAILGLSPSKKGPLGYYLMANEPTNARLELSRKNSSPADISAFETGSNLTNIDSSSTFHTSEEIDYALQDLDSFLTSLDSDLGDEEAPCTRLSSEYLDYPNIQEVSTYKLDAMSDQASDSSRRQSSIFAIYSGSCRNDDAQSNYFRRSSSVRSLPDGTDAAIDNSQDTSGLQVPLSLPMPSHDIEVKECVTGNTSASDESFLLLSFSSQVGEYESASVQTKTPQTSAGPPEDSNPAVLHIVPQVKLVTLPSLPAEDGHASPRSLSLITMALSHASAAETFAINEPMGPELREVGGMFQGPCLFSDDDERVVMSDEE